ncbi:MAG: hypothetical protein HRT61_23980 [Ekhidna sp.]|nr:hypothetical protein [Ekhidna sp.]
MIGEIPSHIGSKLGNTSQEIPNEITESIDTPSVAGNESKDEEIQAPTSLNTETHDTTTKKTEDNNRPSSRKRIKKAPKRRRKNSESTSIQEEGLADTSSSAKEANPADEKSVPPVMEDTLSGQKDEVAADSKPTIQKKTKESGEEQVPLKEKIVPSGGFKLEGQGEVHQPVKTGQKSYLDELRENERRNKEERKEYLKNLSKKTNSFLKQIRTEREEWLENFKS